MVRFIMGSRISAHRKERVMENKFGRMARSTRDIGSEIKLMA
jgi:hypothetical protein